MTKHSTSSSPDFDELRKHLGRNIARIRQLRGLSQEALGLEAGIARSYMSGLEQGKRNPTLKLLIRLAAALDVSIAELFEKPPGN
jgi:transcriptional regulator with XRE-family HTH domain